MTTATLSITDRRERAEQQRKALQRFLTDPEDRFKAGDMEAAGGELTIRLAASPHHARAERRSLSAQLGFGGAYLVPETFADWIEEAMLYASPLRDTGTTVATERGGAWRLPMVDDTAVEGVIVPENTLPSPSEQDLTTFQSLTLYTQKFSSNWTLFPVELLEDASDLLMKRLGGILGRRIGRLQNTTWTPRILAAATLGVTAASDTAIAADELVALYFSVDPAFREQPNFCWHMNNATVQYVRTIKDTTGRYLFRQCKQPGQRSMLLGAPVFVNRDMAGIGVSGNISVAVGDFSKVVMRDVGRELRIRTAGERWADYDQVGIVGFMRSEAALADAGTRPIKYLVHP